jgi:hypothetical protein
MRKTQIMRKTLSSLLAAAAIAGTLAATTTNANAQYRWLGPAVGFGIAGAVIGGILATRPPGYVVYPGYSQPVYASNCYWARQKFRDTYGRVYYSEPVQVCPGYRAY